MYSCRNCGYAEETRNPCVFKHDLLVVTRETAGVTQDLETDPTLVRASFRSPHREKCGPNADLVNSAEVQYPLSQVVSLLSRLVATICD